MHFLCSAIALGLMTPKSQELKTFAQKLVLEALNTRTCLPVCTNLYIERNNSSCLFYLILKHKIPGYEHEEADAKHHSCTQEDSHRSVVGDPIVLSKVAVVTQK